MKRRILSKLIGSINATMFLVVGFVTFMMALFSVLLFVVNKIGFMDYQFLINFLKPVVSFIPDAELVPFVAGAYFLIISFICLIFMLSFKKLIKISNREIVGAYKKRKGIVARGVFLILFIELFAYGILVPINILRIVSACVCGVMLVSAVLLFIERAKIGKEYGELKLKLENAEKAAALGEKVDKKVAMAYTGPTGELNISNDRGQLIIDEIIKLDKLKQEGVISAVEYTRMREKVIKNYGKGKKA